MHLQTSFLASNVCARIRWLRLMVFALMAINAPQAGAQNLILVGGAECTLPQAIGLANYANGIDPSSIGSATTSFGSCTTIPPPLPFYPTGSYGLLVLQPQITLTTIDNYWYGPNALPPIASNITIIAQTGTLTLTASHTGDPTPATANAFRFFYVSGGLEIPAGSLTLSNVTLEGGYAKGGDGSHVGGGGAGMGGAIFNQGSLTLASATLIGNTAQGGTNSGGGAGAGGIGQNSFGLTYYVGGGFGWASAPGAYGGIGGTGNANGCGGGGGFISGSNGGNGGAGTGGGNGGLGSAGPLSGDGGSGASTMIVTASGGNFGQGGSGSCSGGGVGGGGSSFGSGGGFGGGGGYRGGTGGFGGGGGGGGTGSGGFGGFGGGNAATDGGGGSGMGGQFLTMPVRYTCST